MVEGLIRRREMLLGGKEPAPALEFHATYGACIYRDGSFWTGANRYYTDTIPMKAGQVLEFYGYMGANGSAIFKEEDGVRSRLVAGRGSSSRQRYAYTASADCRVGVSNYYRYVDEYATLDGVNIPIIFD